MVFVHGVKNLKYGINEGVIMENKLYIVEVPFAEKEDALAFKELLETIASNEIPSELTAILGYIALHSVLQYTFKESEE